MGSLRRLGVITGIVSLGMLGLVLCVPLLALAVGSGAPTNEASTPVQGIPPRVLAAYRAVDGWCPGLRWQLLAGIGAVESGHGTTRGASVDQESGEVTPWIFGVPLDGASGLQKLPIGRWLGWFGLGGPWQQAVGPMQFLPATFTAWAIDRDQDGVATPHDVDDAVASAANYLCGGLQGAVTDERVALLRYNHDEGYVSRVLAYADRVAARR